MNERLARLRKIMEERGLDAVYIASPENHYYISGFQNPDGRVFVTRENAYLFADFRYSEAARREASEGIEVIEPHGGVISSYLPEIIAESGAVDIGYEEAFLTCAEFEKLTKTLPTCAFSHFSDAFCEMRSVKSIAEINAIAEAQDIADRAFSALLCSITTEMTELDVAAELEYNMKKNGAEDKSFETIAVSGASSSSPHGVPQNKKLEAGFLTLDFGAVVRGYHSDMTRTVVIGKADSEMKRLYNTVLSAQLAAIDFLREGVSCAAADKCARDIIDSAGYKGAFGHSLGHGVGLEIHEMPNLSPSAPAEKLLRRGEIVTVEPGIYLAGKYGCRIEDMVAVTAGGVRNFTHSPKQLIELG